MVTVPDVTGLPLLVTVAVTVRGPPVQAGLADEVMVVVVMAPLFNVIETHQPPVNCKGVDVPEVLSMNRDHAPDGSTPLKACARLREELPKTAGGA
jgi:hypothetical protein